DLTDTSALRFHPTCYYRPDRHSPTETWPALIAAVTDAAGRVTGAHRTWLDPDGFSDRRLGKAPVDTPRRAMGRLAGHGVRFGAPTDILAVGEGIETVLSTRQAFPTLPCIAALSAGHLSALDLPPDVRRLYILRDADPAGDAALERLLERATAAGIAATPLTPRREDFNEDLMAFGVDRLRDDLRGQLLPEDVPRLMPRIRSHSAAG
ncbi:MAG: toprim domain-containing protein, partial [Pseudomonadota bacterium]